MSLTKHKQSSLERALSRGDLPELIFPAELQSLSNGEPDSVVGFAQYIPLVVVIRHEPSGFDANGWFQVQPANDRRDVQVVLLGKLFVDLAGDSCPGLCDDVWRRVGWRRNPGISVPGHADRCAKLRWRAWIRKRSRAV